MAIPWAEDRGGSNDGDDNYHDIFPPGGNMAGGNVLVNHDNNDNALQWCNILSTLLVITTF